MQYIYLAAEDLDGARARCFEAGASDVTDIGKMSWVGTLFHALDPFGNPISFVQSGTEFTGLQRGA